MYHPYDWSLLGRAARPPVDSQRGWEVAGGGGGTGNDGRQLAVEGCARRRTLVTFKDCVVAAFCVNTFGASFISQTIMLGQAEDLLSPIDDVYLVAWIRARISLAASTP